MSFDAKGLLSALLVVFGGLALTGPGHALPPGVLWDIAPPDFYFPWNELDFSDGIPGDGTWATSFYVDEPRSFDAFVVTASDASGQEIPGDLSVYSMLDGEGYDPTGVIPQGSYMVTWSPKVPFEEDTTVHLEAVSEIEWSSYPTSERFELEYKVSARVERQDPAVDALALGHRPRWTWGGLDACCQLRSWEGRQECLVESVDAFSKKVDLTIGLGEGAFRAQTYYVGRVYAQHSTSEPEPRIYLSPWRDTLSLSYDIPDADTVCFMLDARDLKTGAVVHTQEHCFPGRDVPPVEQSLESIDAEAMCYGYLPPHLIGSDTDGGCNAGTLPLWPLALLSLPVFFLRRRSAS